MIGRELNQAFHQGNPVYGIMQIAHSPLFAEAIAQMGLDFVFIDTEHVDSDRTTLAWMCRFYGARKVAPLVRIQAPDPYEAAMVLDCGAQGVIAPYVECVQEVRDLVGAVKYKPLKGNRLKRIMAGEETMDAGLADYLRQVSQDRNVIINIESQPAMNDLDELLRVPGLDAVLIGPHDLSTSLGIPEQYASPLFDKAVREILLKARKARLGAGIHVHYNEDLTREINWYRATGANFVVHHSDFLAFTLAMKRDLGILREALLPERQESGKMGYEG
jgi:2-keto-3-deoxy-L-rhamnonate aldolase RhmA